MAMGDLNSPSMTGHCCSSVVMARFSLNLTKQELNDGQ